MSNTKASAKANERQKFRLEECSAVIVAAVGPYLALMLAGAILAPTTESRLVAVVLMTAVFFFVVLLINFVYKPEYVPGVTLIPSLATRLLVWAGLVLGGVRHVFRQPTFEDQIDAVIAIVISVVVIVPSLECRCEALVGQYDCIAEEVKRRLMEVAGKLGVEVDRVYIAKLQIKYPSLADGAASHIEAERLRTLDEVVRTVTNRTLQHAERLSEIGAHINTHVNADAGKGKGK